VLPAEAVTFKSVISIRCNRTVAPDALFSDTVTAPCDGWPPTEVSSSW
jgi:hypothetical protein